ncbi:hypothetical protein [Rubellimicrobium aerolatum]|uniref:Uncharacterized protein n=1 Tax=Rubellimicrobium aerolatum TaxID=490979 RepID=A0ABW0SCT3_9RHOB|nr:hypothetical protein [Rubellimicrobium aerolatum]MBP1806554.1 hypothetical protein [Rubellimicrobium aerolatum]
MVGSNKSDTRQGTLPGRQTEPPNAGPEFPAEHDLKRAKDLPESVRERIREVDVTEDARGLRETGDLRGPRGDDQEARTRGTHQGE